eukprot:67580_1
MHTKIKHSCLCTYTLNKRDSHYVGITVNYKINYYILTIQLSICGQRVKVEFYHLEFNPVRYTFTWLFNNNIYLTSFIIEPLYFYHIFTIHFYVSLKVHQIEFYH